MRRLMQRHPNLLLKAIQLVVLGALSGTLLFAPACGSGHSPANPASSSPVMLLSISVNPSTGAIPLGGMLQLSAVGTFSDKSAKDISNSVVWASSAPTVAAVTPSGQVNGEAQGGATVTAAQGSVSGSASISILPAMLVSLTVSADNPSIPLGESTQVRAQGTFTDNSSSDVTTLVTWSSSSPGVVSINSAGVAQAKAPGNANMIATLNQITGFKTVTAIPAALTSITVSSAQSLLPLGTNAQLTATGNYSDGSQQNITNSVQWSSSSMGVVSISSAGLAQAKASGSANMIASLNQITGFKTLTVPVALISITVSSTQYALPLGTTAQLTATGNYSDGSQQPLTNSSVQWSSSSPQTISISNAGLATAVAIGSATASASSGAISGSAQLSVSPAQLSGIEVSPQNPLVPMGQQQQMTATGSYTDGTKSDLTRSVTWNSDNPQVATVDNSGVAFAVNVGTANISASYQGQNAASMLTVQPLLYTNFFTLPQLAQQTSNAPPQQQAPDTNLRISYPDASATDLCALIYVFDQNQQLVECCGCVVSQSGLRTLSWQKDLMGNPLTGVKSTAGTVSLVAADHASNPTCDASVISPSGSIVSWSTNLAAAGNGHYAIQEASATSSPLTAAQISALQAQCYFVEVLGSGQGICTCGVGN